MTTCHFNWTYFDVATSGDFNESFLAFKRLVHIVVGHAEDPQMALGGITALGEDDKFGHERYKGNLAVQLGCVQAELAWVRTVHQPEPG